MQVIAIRNQNPSARTAKLIDDMHRLRCRIFCGRLGWSVGVKDNREFDEYDALKPTYILVVSQDDEVLGCARLLPAVGPTMLRDTFSHLLGDDSFHPHALMVESSRFCVDTTRVDGRGNRVHMATLSMFAGIIEWCMVNGLTEIATATDIRVERILRRAGWPMRRLGVPQQINETMSVAGVLNADRASFDRVRPEAYKSNIRYPGVLAD